jgi:transcriptional regulator with XRE-family HTH domain
MNIKNTIGARIRELRKPQKLSQEYLAFLCDLDRTYVGSVENGKRNISIENIEKIARVLSISLRELFGSGIKIHDFA